MTAPTPQSDDRAAALTRALRRVQQSALLAIGTCAVVIATRDAADPEPPPQDAAVWAVGLAFATIAARLIATAPTAAVGTRVGFSVISSLAAVGIAIVGVVTAAGDGAVKTGLAFAAGAAVLALRGPPPIPSASRR